MQTANFPEKTTDFSIFNLQFILADFSNG